MRLNQAEPIKSDLQIQNQTRSSLICSTYCQLQSAAPLDRMAGWFGESAPRTSRDVWPEQRRISNSGFAVQRAFWEARWSLRPYGRPLVQCFRSRWLFGGMGRGPRLLPI